MNLRPATLADIPQLVELFVRLKRAGPYRTFAHSDADARGTMRQCISSATKYLRVIEVDGQIRAALMGILNDHWWGPHRYATDLATFSQVPRGGELLVRDFCVWAWKQPRVLDVVIGQSSGDAIEATENLFTSLGFVRMGGLFRLSRYDAAESAA